MIGFGWYQNVKAYERDKEAMHQTLSKDIDKRMAEAITTLGKQSTEDIREFDEKVGGLFEKVFQNFNDFDLSLKTLVFRSTHDEKTPRTDFAVFLKVTEYYLGKASKGVLDDALSSLLAHLNNPKYKASFRTNRTDLLALAEKLPAEHAGAAQRLRELLAQSLEQHPQE